MGTEPLRIHVLNSRHELLPKLTPEPAILSRVFAVKPYKVQTLAVSRNRTEAPKSGTWYSPDSYLAAIDS